MRQLEQDVGDDSLKLRRGGTGGDQVLPPGAGVKTVGKNQAATTEQHGRRGNRQAVGVVQRQRVVQTLLAFAHREPATERQIAGAERVEIFVGEDAALGTPGGARGVDQRGFGRGIGHPGLRRCRWRREPIGKSLQRHHRQPATDVFRHRLHLFQPAVDRDHETRLRVLHHVADLVAPVVGVDRHDPDAERVQRVVVKEELGPLVEQHRDAVSATIAGVSVDAPLLLDPCQGLRPRDLEPAGVIGTPGHRRHRVGRPFTMLANRAQQRLIESSVLEGVHGDVE